MSCAKVAGRHIIPRSELRNVAGMKSGPRTTKLCDRTANEVTLDEGERM
jgi:hypothetical protein